VAAGVGYLVQIWAVSVVLAVAALFLAGFSVAARPKDSALLLLAAGTSFASFWAINPVWDAVRIVPAVACGVCILAAILVVLPRWAQYGAVSLLVLYHFGGILASITGPPPQPWLSQLSGVSIFRPLSQFGYLYNA